jgi:hypothetical protein
MINLAATGVVNDAASPSGFGPAQWSTIIAAVVAVTGYMLTQAQARRERRDREFADALAAVEEYLEAPYRIRRRQAATPEAREALTSALSGLQARIALHRAWLQVEAPAVGRAYEALVSAAEALVSAARSEAGAQMAEAWNAAPLTSDTDMNLKVAYPHPDSDAERAKVIAAMRQHLRFRPDAAVLRALRPAAGTSPPPIPR